jgi:hypothetical protein
MLEVLVIFDLKILVDEKTARIMASTKRRSGSLTFAVADVELWASFWLVFGHGA